MRRLLRADYPILLGLLVTLLGGCAAPWPFPQPAPDLRLPDGQQILRPVASGSYNGDLYSLDPAGYLSSLDYEIAQLIFPQLVALDGNLQPVDWAAERHEVSADGLTYTFHLRKGMTWSDGSPIDANTFAYSINRALDPCWVFSIPVPGYPLDYPLKRIMGADAFTTGNCPPGAIHSASTLRGQSLLTPDPLTLQIRLSAPAAYFLAGLMQPPAWGVPERLVERYTQPTQLPDRRQNGVLSTWTQHLTDDGGLGGNLFKLKLWSHPNVARITPSPLPAGTTVEPTVGIAPTFGADGRAHVLLERNERFWGRKPLLRSLDYTLYDDQRAAWDAFSQGAGDVGYPRMEDLPSARRLKGTAFSQTPLLDVVFLQPNWRLAPFDDIRIRQAFWLALDRRAIAHEALQDTALPSIHLLPEGAPEYHADLTDAAGRREADALTADLVAARALASAYAAQTCQGDYARCPSIYLRGAGAVRNSGVARVAQGQWQSAFPGWAIHVCGLDVRCGDVQIPNPQTYQLSLGETVSDYPDPYYFLSSLWTTSGTYNRAFVSIPAADALCAQADASQAQPARIPLYQQAERLFVEQVAAIPLFQRKITYVERTQVVGWSVAPSGQTPLSVWQATYLTR